MPHNANSRGSATPLLGFDSGTAVRWAERAVTCGALVAGYALLCQAVITTVEIVSRKLFNFSLQGVDELGGYALAITASLGFGYATLTRTHTRVDIVLRLLPRRTRGLLNLVAVVVLLTISVAMLWYARIALAETLRYGSIANSPLETPLWIPQSLWLAGFVTFVAVAALMTYRAVVLALRRDFASLDIEFGTTTLDEEIASLEEPIAKPGGTSVGKVTL